MTNHSAPGEALIALGMLIWVSVYTGQWWVGACLWLAGFALNMLLYMRRKG